MRPTRQEGGEGEDGSGDPRRCRAHCDDHARGALAFEYTLRSHCHSRFPWIDHKRCVLVSSFCAPHCVVSRAQEEQSGDSRNSNNMIHFEPNRSFAFCHPPFPPPSPYNLTTDHCFFYLRTLFV